MHERILLVVVIAIQLNCLVHAQADSKTYGVLKAEVKELRHMIDHLKEQSVKQNAQIMELTEFVIGDADTTADDDKETLSRTKRGVHWRRRRRRDPEIGFLISLSTPKLPVEKEDVLIFDHVITNIGNAFDRGTGKFVCQIPGTYMFHLNLVSEMGSYIEASIKVNGIAQSTAVSDHRISTSAWDQGSADAILILSQNDVVSVNINWPAKKQIVHGEGMTSFSGYLLRKHYTRRGS